MHRQHRHIGGQTRANRAWHNGRACRTPARGGPAARWRDGGGRSRTTGCRAAPPGGPLSPRVHRPRSGAAEPPPPIAPRAQRRAALHLLRAAVTGLAWQLGTNDAVDPLLQRAADGDPDAVVRDLARRALAGR